MAATAPRKRQSVALDTNVLLDHADGVEHVLSAIEIMKERVDARFVVLPTVIQELTHLAVESSEPDEMRMAAAALGGMLTWGFQPLNFIPAGHAITESIAQKIRDKGLIPAAEVNDSLFVSEAALAQCSIILSSDGHVKDIDQTRLNRLLEDCDVSAVAVSSPRQIVKQFGGRRTRR